MSVKPSPHKELKHFVKIPLLPTIFFFFGKEERREGQRWGCPVTFLQIVIYMGFF